MLNILLERALQNRVSQPNQSQPIFTFSYSTKKKDDNNLNQIHKQPELKKSNKTDKIVQKGLTTWKSKTIEKLQKYNLNNPQSNIPNIWTRKTGVKINKKYQKAKSFQIQHFNLNQNEITKGSQYIIRSSSPHRSLKSPMGKTLYLKYKQIQEEKINQKIKFSSLNSRSVATQRASRNSGSIFMEPKLIQCSIDESDETKKGETSNTTFLKTIQYIPSTKEEIIHRKTEDLQNRKKSLRKTKEKFRKPITFELNNTESFQNSCEQDLSLNGNPKQFVHQIKQKKNNFHIRFSTKRTEKRFQSYRPWSPIKTNPLYYDDQELMLQTFTETIKRKSYQKQSG